MIFKLSNKIIQLIFGDQTQLIISAEKRIVSFYNKNKEKKVFPLSFLSDCTDHELSKKLKYTKDLLSQMAQKGKKYNLENAS